MDLSALGVIVGVVATIVAGVAAVNKITRKDAVSDAETARKVDAVYDWFREPGPDEDRIPLPAMTKRSLREIEAVRQIAQTAADAAGAAHEAARLAHEKAELAHATADVGITEMRAHVLEEESKDDDRDATLARLLIWVNELRSSVASLSNPKEGPHA